LKSTVVESYTSVVFGISEAKDTTILDAYVPELFQYLGIVCNTSNSLDFHKSIVALIGDLTTLYGKKIQPLLALPFVVKLIQDLENSPNKEHKNVGKWARSTITKALK